MNVRNLISQFENILDKSTDIPAPKTPRTPKLTKAFFKSSDSLDVPEAKSGDGFKSTERKLIEIEDDIRKYKNRISTSDDTIIVVLELLDLLFKVAQIDADGNVRAKQRKAVCFGLFQECKEELQRKFPNTAEEKTAAPVQVREESPQIKPTPPVIQISEPKPAVSMVSVKQEIATLEANKDIKKSEKKKPAPISIPRPITPKVLSIIMPEPTIETEHEDNNNLKQHDPSLIKLKSVRSLMLNFEPLSDENQNGKLPKTPYPAHSNDAPESPNSDTSETSEAPTVVHVSNEEELPKTPSNSDDEEKINKNVDLENLCSEIEYYKGLINDLDPDDEIRVEIVEANIHDVIKKLQHLEVVETRDSLLKAANYLVDNLNQKKTGKETIIDNDEEFEKLISMDTNEEAENAAIYDILEDLDALYEELKKYEQIIDNLDEHEVGKIRIFKEKISDIFEHLETYQQYLEEVICVRRQECVNIASQLINNLTSAEKKILEDKMQSVHNEIQTYCDLTKSSININEIGDIHENVMKIYRNLDELEVHDEELVYGKQKGKDKIYEILKLLSDKREENMKISDNNKKPAILNDNKIEGLEETCAPLLRQVEPISENEDNINENNIDSNEAEESVQQITNYHDNNEEDPSPKSLDDSETETRQNLQEDGNETTNNETLDVITVESKDYSSPENVSTNDLNQPLIEEDENKPQICEKSDEISAETINNCSTENVNADDVNQPIIKEAITDENTDCKENDNLELESGTSVEIIDNVCSIPKKINDYVVEECIISKHQQPNLAENKTNIQENDIEKSNADTVDSTNEHYNTTPVDQPINLLDEYSAQIKRYKDEAPKMDLSDTVATNLIVKDINTILSKVDAVKASEEDFPKKLTCMKDIVEILKIFKQKTPNQEKDDSTAMRKLWTQTITTVKAARTDLEQEANSVNKGEIIGNLMHLREMVRRESVISHEDEELKNASLEKLTETIKIVNPNLN